ncbi:MAG: peptidoglycan DD-metalloendopeptidase family protein [Thiotrichales bacterium]|nr:peptidoglycan DD-metalloendopeptidase family protein [Thiotrichales bacterium]
MLVSFTYALMRISPWSARRGRGGAKRGLARFARVFAAALLLTSATGAPGQSDYEIRGDLEQVRARLETIARELTRAYGEHDTQTQALARSEKLAAGIRSEIAGLDERLAAAHVRAGAARRASDRTRGALSERRRELARAIRASYRFARRDSLARLLDLESLRNIDRLLAYHSVIEQAHAHRIGAIADTLSRLEAQEAKVAEEVAAIAALLGERQHRLTELEERRTARAEAMQALAERIQDRESRVARLRTDEHRLVELVEALRTSLTDDALKIPGRRNFEQSRGRLRWPVSGRVLARYGTPRGKSGLMWQGMLIEAPAGETVHSIHGGRVAYADWLRGFGLLLIIEHEDEFMSLYGHNDTLTRETGDWVDSGEIVATVGDSGGHSRPALYFEIRRTGRPVDPRHWCMPTAGAALVSPLVSH